MKVRLINDCGSSSWFVKEIPVSCGNGGGGVTPLSFLDYRIGLGNYFISSNNDGINDELKLSNLSSENSVMENHIVIYNSQGAIVYEAYGNNSFRGIGNMGAYAGIILPDGVYLYKISGVKETSGYIYIKRK